MIMEVVKKDDIAHPCGAYSPSRGNNIQIITQTSTYYSSVIEKLRIQATGGATGVEISLRLENYCSEGT